MLRVCFCVSTEDFRLLRIKISAKAASFRNDEYMMENHVIILPTCHQHHKIICPSFFVVAISLLIAIGLVGNPSDFRLFTSRFQKKGVMGPPCHTPFLRYHATQDHIFGRRSGEND